jgi:hypothetical protein
LQLVSSLQIVHPPRLYRVKKLHVAGLRHYICHGNMTRLKDGASLEWPENVHFMSRESAEIVEFEIKWKN